MPTGTPFVERRKPRVGPKVLHRHQVGESIVLRVSDLVFLKGSPVALIDWINMGGVRTPLFSCALDLAQLRAGSRDGLYEYQGVTRDPRFHED